MPVLGKETSEEEEDYDTDEDGEWYDDDSGSDYSTAEREILPEDY